MMGGAFGRDDMGCCDDSLVDGGGTRRGWRGVDVGAVCDVVSVA